MLNILWRVVGFGTPETVTQFFMRFVWFICLAIVCLFGSMGGTALGWFMTIIFSVAAGISLTDGKHLLNKQQELYETGPQDLQFALEAMLDPDRDYVVNPGAPVWMTVGNYSLQVVQQDNGGATVNAYHLYHEDQDPIAKLEV